MTFIIRELIFRRIRTLSLILLIMPCGSIYGGTASLTAHAQSSTATLSGTVVDEAGAVIPEVRITVLNLGTAIQRHSTTNAEGTFAIPLLPAGSYHLAAQQSGFATLEVRDVVLNVNDQMALRIKLKIGEIGETVTVVGGLEGLQQSFGGSTVISRRFVENLPLNGRSFLSLIELAPGSVLTRANFEEQGQFSVNGQRANANYFTLDGVSANFGVSAGAAPGQAAAGGLPALTALGGTNNLVSIDALEEFRVHTSAYAPEFGRTTGAQISVVSRSGTNEFHGSFFNYYRNGVFDANDWFANSLGLPKPGVRQNDFGGVVGGALVRDQLFFFSSYEGLRLRQPQVGFTEVPSLAARAAAPLKIRPFFDAYPLPNGRETSAGLAEFTASYSEPSRLDATSVRIDHFVSNRLTFFGRYNIAPSQVIQRGSVIRPGFTAQPLINPTVALSLNTRSRASLRTQTLTAGASFAVTPYIVNETRANWSRATAANDFFLDNFGGAIPLEDAILFPPERSTADGGFQLLLEKGIGSNLNIGKGVDNRQQQLNIVNHLSIASGVHQFKLGADYRRLTPVYGPATYDQLAAFIGIGDETGAPTGTLLSGKAKTVHIFGGANPRHPVFNNVSAYAQHVWRVSHGLTLTYGLRWELNTPPYEANGNHALALRRLEDLDQLMIAPPGTPLWQTTYYNFAPRLGLAYQVYGGQGRELVVRTALGLFYDVGTGQAAQGFGSVAPFINVRRFDNIPLPLTPEQAQPLPPPGSFPLFPMTLVIFDPSLQLPRSYQWNVSLEQSMGSEQTFTVAYVAALGRRLLREDAVLGLGAATSVVRLTRNAASSSYQALQAQATRRVTSGLQAVASYTWSHSIDNASSDALSRLRPAGIFPNLDDLVGDDRGPSDFDVRHAFTFAAAYNIPAPQTPSAARALLRNWSLDAIFRARTATPLNVVTRTDVTGNGIIIALNRPDLLEGVPVYLEDPAVAGGRRINRAAFRAPPPGRQGSLGQNALRSFGAAQLDLALRRELNLNERWRLQLRAECFNVFNHPNFGNPIGDLSNPQFGVSTQMLARSLGTGGINGGLSPIYQVGGPRSFQLAVKLLF